MAIRRGNGAGQRRGQPLVFLAVFLDRSARYEILQFLVRSQSQHFLAAAGGIARSAILVHDVKQLLELEGRTPGEDRNQLLSYQVRHSTRECIFLQNRHGMRKISPFWMDSAVLSA